MMQSRKFIDRAGEMEALERLFGHKGLRFAILTGRRRVGKSRLLWEFTAGKKNALRVQFEKRGTAYNLARLNRAGRCNSGNRGENSNLIQAVDVCGDVIDCFVCR